MSVIREHYKKMGSLDVWIVCFFFKCHSRGDVWRKKMSPIIRMTFFMWHVIMGVSFDTVLTFKNKLHVTLRVMCRNITCHPWGVMCKLWIARHPYCVKPRLNFGMRAPLPPLLSSATLAYILKNSFWKLRFFSFYLWLILFSISLVTFSLCTWGSSILSSASC